MPAAVFSPDEGDLTTLIICVCGVGGLYFLATGAYAVAAALFGSMIGALVGLRVSGWPSQQDHQIYAPIGATLFLIVGGSLGLAAPPRMSRRGLRIWGWTTGIVGITVILVMARFTSETMCHPTPPRCMTGSPATLWPWAIVGSFILYVAFITFLFFIQSHVAAGSAGEGEGRGSH